MRASLKPLSRPYTDVRKSHFFILLGEPTPSEAGGDEGHEDVRGREIPSQLQVNNYISLSIYLSISQSIYHLTNYLSNYLSNIFMVVELL